MKSEFEFLNDIIDFLEAHLELVKVFSYALGTIAVICFKDLRSLVIYIFRSIFDLLAWPIRQRIIRKRNSALERRIIEEIVMLPVGVQSLLGRFLREGPYIEIEGGRIVYHADVQILLDKGWIRCVKEIPPTYCIRKSVLRALQKIVREKKRSNGAFDKGK